MYKSLTYTKGIGPEMKTQFASQYMPCFRQFVPSLSPRLAGSGPEQACSEPITYMASGGTQHYSEHTKNLANKRKTAKPRRKPLLAKSDGAKVGSISFSPFTWVTCVHKRLVYRIS